MESQILTPRSQHEYELQRDRLKAEINKLVAEHAVDIPLTTNPEFFRRRAHKPIRPTVRMKEPRRGRSSTPTSIALAPKARRCTQR